MKMTTMSQSAEEFEVRLASDVRFGAAGINFSGQYGTPATRDLLMDVYAPVGGDPDFKASRGRTGIRRRLPSRVQGG